MILATPFMSWIDYLHEVGDTIRRDRGKLLEAAGEAAGLEIHALALREHIVTGQAELLTRVMRNYTLSEIDHASERADSRRAKTVDLAHLPLPLAEALAKLDGTHLASEAVRAFHDGKVIGAVDAATATDDECREALRRVQAWWAVAGVPVYERLRRM